MEVVVAEEKKKIFRARKTMKMSDRLQLESLHSTLLTSTSSLSNPSPPPLMNGTHKDDGQKSADKEQNNISGSNSPNATSPLSHTPVSSPVPFLSLNLSPSPPGSQSPKEREITSPSSPPQSAFFDGDKTENEEKDSSPALLDESSSSTRPKKDTTGAPLDEKEQEKRSTTEHPSVDTCLNDSASSSHAAPVDSEFTRPIEGESGCSPKTNPDSFVSKIKDVKPYSPKASSPSTSLSKSHSDAEKKKSVVVKEESIKDEKTKKVLIKRGFKCDEKMEVDLVKEEIKKGKTEVGHITKSSRPSSTPPSNTGQEKSLSSTLKRTLSEGSEIDIPTVKREGKRPKVEHEELEAQLELKISAKAGNHHKLEKIVQQLVEERLKILEFTVFDKNFQDLKARVDKIDCANKHQTALSSLQTKISRLVKKFGEANQASENKRKKEALAAAAAAAAVAAPVATTTTTAATAAKTTTVTTVPQPQRVLRRQTVEPQPEVPREGMAPSLGKTPALSVKVEMEEEDMGYEQETDVSRQIAMATKLAEYSEGRCRADVKLRPISSHLESVLYNNCKRSSGNPRPDRYASYLFRYLVPYDVYCDWVAKVNYVGLMGKEALPTNLRRAMRMYIDHRFPLLSTESWREIRDVINEILRVKRRPEFFRDYDGRTSMLY